MVSSENLLILLTKMPEAGKVKSRLSSEIGPEKAAKVYERLLRNTLEQMKATNSEKAIALEGNEALFTKAFGEWMIWPQEGNDLGDRMALAFERAFQIGYKRVVLIGGDCPEMTTEILEWAFEKLNDHDLVLGPSQDGGYYLIGLKKTEPRLFENMQWSHNKVFEQTVQRAAEQNLKVALLPTLRDIDHLADLNAFPSFAP
jgi:rSAM/selenodomain-associated transferase 1